MFLDAYAEIGRDADMRADVSGTKNLKPKAWKLLSGRMQKASPELDLPRLKYKWDLLKSGWVNTLWCESHLMSGDGARRPDESWTLYFERRLHEPCLAGMTNPEETGLEAIATSLTTAILIECSIISEFQTRLQDGCLTLRRPTRSTSLPTG